MKTETLSGADNRLDRWLGASRRERLKTFEMLPREQASNLFLEMNSRDQLEVLSALPRPDRRTWLRLLAPDDVADVIQLAPETDKAELLAELDDVTRREVTALLAYKEDKAGGLMNPRFARVRPDMTVDEAISYLRHQSANVETIYYAYALNDAQQLLGVVSFRDLFSADRQKLVRDVMKTRFIAASEDMDQEAVAKLVTDHNLLAVPVLDRDGRLQGIVSVDDIVDVVSEEASEDLQQVGGTEALHAPYLEIGFWQMIRKRAG